MRQIVRTTMVCTALLGACGAAVAQSTNAERGAAQGAETGGNVAGPLGAAIGSVTGAAVGGAADLANAVTAPAIPPRTVKRTTCVTDAAGNKRCDSIETTD